MSKSILAIDTPEGCIRCDCCYTKDYDFRERIDGERICGIENTNVDDYCDCINLRKPDWCPLWDLPEKKEENKYNNSYEKGMKDGFNTCINEILKGDGAE